MGSGRQQGLGGDDSYGVWPHIHLSEPCADICSPAELVEIPWAPAVVATMTPSAPPDALAETRLALAVVEMTIPSVPVDVLVTILAPVVSALVDEVVIPSAPVDALATTLALRDVPVTLLAQADAQATISDPQDALGTPWALLDALAILSVPPQVEAMIPMEVEAFRPKLELLIVPSAMEQ